VKKRIIITVCLIALLAAAIITMAILRKNFIDNNGETEQEKAFFPIEYTDRLAGYPVTGIHSDSSTIEIRFGDVGFIRKTYAVIDNSGEERQFDEKSEHTIDGISVTFSGEKGMIYLAVWNNNNFAYTICINSGFDGVSAEEMTEYVKGTK